MSSTLPHPSPAVDPKLFTPVCVEKEVGEDAEDRDTFEKMIERFGDSAVSATHRWSDVAVPLGRRDGRVRQGRAGRSRVKRAHRGKTSVEPISLKIRTLEMAFRCRKVSIG